MARMDEHREADLIDAMGRALYECDPPVWQWSEDQGSRTVEHVTWHAAPDQSKLPYVERACAALSSMRMPPSALIEKVARAAGLSVDQVNTVIAQLVDAALAAAPGGSDDGARG